MSSLHPDHEAIMRACENDPALRDALLEALNPSSKPDRLRSIGRTLGKMRSRIQKLSDRTRHITDRVRDGYRDETKGSSDADDDR